MAVFCTTFRRGQTYDGVAGEVVGLEYRIPLTVDYGIGCRDFFRKAVPVQVPYVNSVSVFAFFQIVRYGNRHEPFKLRGRAIVDGEVIDGLICQLRLFSFAQLAHHRILVFGVKRTCMQVDIVSVGQLVTGLFVHLNGRRIHLQFVRALQNVFRYVYVRTFRLKRRLFFAAACRTVNGFYTARTFRGAPLMPVFKGYEIIFVITIKANRTGKSLDTCILTGSNTRNRCRVVVFDNVFKFFHRRAASVARVGVRLLIVTAVNLRQYRIAVAVYYERPFRNDRMAERRRFYTVAVTAKTCVFGVACIRTGCRHRFAFYKVMPARFYKVFYVAITANTGICRITLFRTRRFNRRTCHVNVFGFGDRLFFYLTACTGEDNIVHTFFRTGCRFDKLTGVRVARYRNVAVLVVVTAIRAGM